MKISLAWLNDFVDLADLGAPRVAELLSLHTAEVEGVEAVGAAIADVLVGQVVHCGRHPDADKLSVTKVEFGAGEAVDVVCGAPNVRAGLKVAFAPVGAVLPGGLKIKKAKLRGAPSVGMICSERELQLSEEHAGILELPADAPVGARLVDYLSLADWVLDLDNKSLTHRPDLWGHYGFARELAAILKRPLRPLASSFSWPEAGAAPRIERADPDCVHYVGVALELPGGPRPSPQRLRARLLAVGLRPRNELVDLSNWVMLECGQPLHAFDADRLAGGAVTVRAARAGESIRLLDESERALLPADLVIADAERPVALAGVMGGAASAVSAGTERVLLESAVFRASRIRRTAQRLALRTDASSRFEKSLDPAGALLAAGRFCHLLSSIRPDARVSGPPAIVGDAAASAPAIRFHPARCARLLGVDPGTAEMRGSLERLGFTVAPAGEAWEVRVPSWRAAKDVTMEVDLVEEVGRLHGYHRIAPAPLVAPVVPPATRPQRLLARALAERMRGAHGAAESQSYSFLARRYAELQRRSPADFVRLANPMQADADLVRRDPVASLMEQAGANARERASGRLCEIARGYEPQADAEPRERAWACLLEWERKPAPLEGPQSLYARSRAIAQDLLRVAGADAEAVPGGDPAAPWLHPAHALRWVSGQRTLAWSGRLDPRLAAAAEGEHVDYAAVLLDLDALLAASADAPARRFVSPPRLPAIKLDVALALPSTVPYAAVEQAVRAAGGRLLESLELFDLYSGPNLPAGTRSLAFHAVLRAADRTLEDKDEQNFIAKVKEAADSLGGTLRA